MNIAYSEWSADPHWRPEQQAPADMVAFVGARRLAHAPPDRWKSLAITIGVHAAVIYVAFFTAFVVPKKQELQAITVSITATEASKPEPPIVPKLERVPDVVLPKLPQIETAAPPSPTAIMAAPRVPPAPAKDAKDTQEVAISPPRFDAGYLNNPAPVYPNMSRRLREIGVVQLRVRVSTGGQPLEIQLAGSSGYARLDDAARAAVQKWKFVPAMRGGNPVEAWVIVPVEFSLTRS
jgi:protein TonB